MSLQTKKQMSLKERLSIIDKISKDINDKAGKKLVGRIGADPEIEDKLRIKFIPSKSMDFNRAVGGGYPRSRCTIIAGNADSGKTSRLLEDIGYNMEKSDFVSLWIESEKSLELDYALNTFHIDPKRFIFLEYDPDMGAEGVLDKLYAIMSAVPIDMVVINSLKCLTPKKIIEGEMDNATPAVAARLNSLMAQKFTALVSESGTAFVLITHTYTGIGTYMSPQVISGGRAIAYWSALTLQFSKLTIGTNEPVGKDEGLHIKVSVKKNHCILDRNPYVTFDYYIVFGQGTEMIMSSIPAFIDKGILSVNGMMYQIYDKNGKEISGLKFKGKNAYRQYMVDNPKLFQQLIDRVGTISTIRKMSDEEIQQAQEEEKAEELDVEIVPKK